MKRLAIGLVSVALLVGAGWAVTMLMGARKSGNLPPTDGREVAEKARLAHSPDALTAIVAITALGRMAPSGACDALREVATTDQRPEVRKAAVVSLAQRKEPEALDALREMVTRDTAPEVRGEAAMELARAGTPDDVRILVTAAGRETDPQVARKLVLAMGHLLGVKFSPPDPKMTPEQRRQQVERTGKAAMELADKMKNHRAVGGGKHPSP